MKNIIIKFKKFSLMKRKMKSVIMQNFNKIIIKCLKSDRILSPKYKLNINENIKKFNSVQNKLIDLIFNLQYLDYIANSLENSKLEQFNENLQIKNDNEKFNKISVLKKIEDYSENKKVKKKCLKIQNFNKNLLKKKIIQKFFSVFLILQKAYNPSNELLEFLEVYKNCFLKLDVKKSFFETNIVSKKKEFFFENKKYKVLEKIKGYLKQKKEFKIILDDDFILSILFIIMKKN